MNDLAYAVFILCCVGVSYAFTQLFVRSNLRKKLEKEMKEKGIIP